MGLYSKNFTNLLLMNHCPEYIDIWHGTSLGPGDLRLFNEVPVITNDNSLKGDGFI